LQAQLGRLNAAAGSQGWTVSLGSGKFSGLNVTFDPRDTAHFDEIVDILKNSPNLRLQIEAFPANHGSPSHRREVAQAHADSVLRAFTRHGADEARIQAFAAATAAAPPAAGKRSNPRQIEIIFSDAEGEFRQAAASR
jgi:hypothetical protein